MLVTLSSATTPTSGNLEPNWRDRILNIKKAHKYKFLIRINILQNLSKLIQPSKFNEQSPSGLVAFIFILISHYTGSPWIVILLLFLLHSPTPMISSLWLSIQPISGAQYCSLHIQNLYQQLTRDKFLWVRSALFYLQLDITHIVTIQLFILSWGHYLKR